MIYWPRAVLIAACPVSRYSTVSSRMCFPHFLIFCKYMYQQSPITLQMFTHSCANIIPTYVYQANDLVAWYHELLDPGLHHLEQYTVQTHQCFMRVTRLESHWHSHSVNHWAMYGQAIPCHMSCWRQSLVQVLCGICWKLNGHWCHTLQTNWNVWELSVQVIHF